MDLLVPQSPHLKTEYKSCLQSRFIHTDPVFLHRILKHVK